MDSGENLRKAAREGLEKERADFGPLLVYADWLLEQGDPLGEFISVTERDLKKTTENLKRVVEHIEKILDQAEKEGVSLTKSKPRSHVEWYAREARRKLVEMYSSSPGTDVLNAVDSFSKSVSSLRNLSRRTPTLAHHELRQDRPLVLYYPDELTKRNWRLENVWFRELGPAVEQPVMSELSSFERKLKNAAHKTRKPKKESTEAPTMMQVFLERYGRQRIARKSRQYRQAAEAAALRWQKTR